MSTRRGAQQLPSRRQESRSFQHHLQRHRDQAAHGPVRGPEDHGISPTSLSGDQRCQMSLDVFRRSMSADLRSLLMRRSTGSPSRPTRHKMENTGPAFSSPGGLRGFSSHKPRGPPIRLRTSAIPRTGLAPRTSLTSRFRATGCGERRGTGNLALVHRRRQGVEQIVVAVAADTGNANELGEASIALHIGLGNPAEGRLPGNIADGVTTLLFPGHRAEQPITAATLAAKRGALLQAVGGETAVRACGAP